jgi:septation ring formation regulator EzrA
MKKQIVPLCTILERNEKTKIEKAGKKLGISKERMDQIYDNYERNIAAHNRAKARLK